MKGEEGEGWNEERGREKGGMERKRGRRKETDGM